ncbi:unannotated protein [freshwater metagenome]|uniref:Unannotated protein n=1 Tax=freshwater metagenome TaxID=449393 RepID=A0A6J6VVX7_9ZZZZ
MWRDTVRASNDGAVSVHTLRGVPVEVHERGSGAIVVFVHGEDGLLFSGPLIAGIAHGASVRSIVLPGWGDEPWPAHITGVDDLAIVLLDYLVSLPGPVVLVGVSLGAWVVAEALVRGAANVRAAVLVAPVGIKVRGRTDRDYLDLYAAPADEIARAMHASTPVVDRTMLAAVEFDELARAQHATTRYVWKPYFHDPKLRRRLDRVTVPVSIIYGATDRFVYDADEFYAAYANAFAPPARVVRVADAAHRVDEECPRVIIDEIQRLVAEGPA